MVRTSPGSSHDAHPVSPLPCGSHFNQKSRNSAAREAIWLKSDGRFNIDNRGLSKVLP
jgi:hypothetical protein